MIKILLLLTALFFTGCVTKRGISAQYYNDCKEYYDLQGFYHKDCDGEVVTYKEISDAGGKVIDKFVDKKEKPKGNVW